MMPWLVALHAAAIFCIARGVADIRSNRYVWGALRVSSAAILLLTPIPSQAVKVNVISVGE